MAAISLSDLPASPLELKSIMPYLQRAREMEKVDPVITYWCSFHAAQTCMSVQPVEPESRTFLMKLLDYLEQVGSTASLSDHDAITNNMAATAYVENFALKIFDGADQEDLKGNSTKSTASRFLAAACFLEVLTSLTNQPEADILEKIKYAKWKAASIVKAIREGTSQSQTLTGSSSLAAKSTDWAPTDDASQGPPVTGSSSSSPLPPHIQTSDVWPTTELSPNSASHLPSPIPFQDPNIALNSSQTAFPSTVFPPVYDSRHNLPSVPTAGDPIPSAPDLDPSRMAIEPVIGVAPRHFPSQPPQSHITPQHPISSPPNPPGTGLSSTTHNLPPPLPPPQQSAGTVLSRASMGAVSSSQSGQMMDPTLIGVIQKHAKYAISALNYEDVVTARSELLLALDKLALLG
ncbi:uncharacterized protein MELLADRAFT_89755 [Melampsora larici-populina 98AG31]|uniref:Vta1/callose synthase N-terminal domain-containing protein n=1 Tax=Melampsora larici-populina (strain 98AG31 / pathotype 3-4-7) TaxID=747676 RepID=F4RUI1_MELLP|nr:uncharacterized protein MELLADRAFT_89755 [Melampsora larici-populina 98AG31]EGG03939.1 hypothetical protein MELLADRAFT_89755 [Melampsora larici-populina 98AG31]